MMNPTDCPVETAGLVQQRMEELGYGTVPSMIGKDSIWAFTGGASNYEGRHKPYTLALRITPRKKGPDRMTFWAGAAILVDTTDPADIYNFVTVSGRIGPAAA